MNSLIALLILLFVLMLVLVLIAHKTKPKMNKAYFIKHWKAIESQKNYSSAVLKAASLMDESMKKIGIKGGTTGERINNAVGYLSNINGTWSAHKLRNKIAHEHDSEPSETECKKALRQFKKALKDLGAL